ncbi:2TM domain-containing protein [Aquimarina sp. AU58]|uniref:2TM domain-containing protein n=1 Tax=Aquimarina sp. AU58 TaxID=1874112 RepID=UPI000D6DE430|nr:2TM domain-containing protein [Aquimarina sp. AU58]
MKDFEKVKRYERAKERVEGLKKFYTKLSVYIIVISFLAGLNYYENEWRHAWFLWVAFGWGIGLIIHAIKTYGINPLYNKDWEERKIKEFMHNENF